MMNSCSGIPLQIILSCIDAGYGFLCATYNEERVKDPKELRVCCA